MGKTRDSANLVSDNNIFVDIANDRVGIGITIPGYDLDVSGSINLSGNLYQNGSEFIASYATSAGIATVADYATTAGISTYSTSAGIATVADYATTAGISTYSTSAGIATVAEGLTGTPDITVNNVTASQITGIGTISSIGTGYNDAVKFINSSGTENGQLCKAWVNFNGTGTVAIRSSFNVSSITDNGTGNYTVNFANSFPDSNYAYSHAYSNEVSVQHTIGFLNGYDNSTLNVEHFNARDSSNKADKAHVLIAVFR